MAGIENGKGECPTSQAGNALRLGSTQITRQLLFLHFPIVYNKSGIIPVFIL
jgi:hypothetical protein